MIAAHADWSFRPAGRWFSVAERCGAGWQVHAPQPVGEARRLSENLSAWAGGAAVVLGCDFPIGLPAAYARQLGHATDFRGFLAALDPRADFFRVCDDFAEIRLTRPFFPRGRATGVRQADHWAALNLADRADLFRVCDRATGRRRAGAPLFWTVGPNQVGKAALHAWAHVLLPALRQSNPAWLWPFDGDVRALLQPGRLVIAEAYPAEAAAQAGIRLAGSKRVQAVRKEAGDGLREALARRGAEPSPALRRALVDGFGADAAGEDRFDSVLGLLSVLGVLDGSLPDSAPAAETIRRWEGWVLGQAAPAGTA